MHGINKGLANIYTIRYSNVSITLPNAVGVYASAFFLHRVVFALGFLFFVMKMVEYVYVRFYLLDIYEYDSPD